MKLTTTPAIPLDLVGAGDQGIMFGYACNGDARADAAAHQPGPPASRGDLLRCVTTAPWITCLPDGKTQVSVVYENDKPVAIDTILISTQHTAEVAGISDEQGNP